MKPWLRLLNELETPVCRRWSQSSRRRWFFRPFALISRLGNGVFWYSLMAVMPIVDGLYGLEVALHMLLTGAAALLLYKSLKGMTRRVRPCHYDIDIAAGVPPLDKYSFPSGHTLHAVSFSTVALYYYPQLAWLLVPFTLLVAASRVVLGLHYPSDVLVASIVGLALGYGSVLLVA
ncbi:MAG: phosphatase PAP2 family protein [Thiohalocapsa sp.]|jgi:undecaprenyl-diphosphatase|nr:phosphatase PAP2 family protein [Thiohalocapsa sp.]MCF7988884.1 phosphatase PAP2 family protein [Thiohalocapsa sp.]